MEKVILAGASGYFGSLAEHYLKKSGVEVLSAGRRVRSDLHFDLDLLEEFASSQIDGEIDVFIHAAATHEVDCVESPYKCVNRNVAGTRAALDFCVKNKIKKFIYISTFHVYGTDVGVINERTPVAPLHDYGITHFQAEEYVRMYTRKGLIDGVCLRPSNMFGLPVSLINFDRWTLIPFSFCKDAVEKGEVELKTPGHQYRNFVSVEDIVNVIKKISSNEINAEIINIPGVDTYSIREFAKLVQNVMSEKFDIKILVTAPDGEVKSRLFYESDYFDPESMNFSHIKEHVNQFCGHMIANGKN